MAAINQIEEGREKKRAALLSVGSALLLVPSRRFWSFGREAWASFRRRCTPVLTCLPRSSRSLRFECPTSRLMRSIPTGAWEFENFSAFVETGLLALTALYIAL